MQLQNFLEMNSRNSNNVKERNESIMDNDMTCLLLLLVLLVMLLLSGIVLLFVLLLLARW